MQVTLVDVDAGRAEVAAALGVGFALPADAPAGATSSSTPARPSAGLQRSLDLLAPEGTVSTSAGTATRRCGSRSAARSTRAASASGPARSARSPPPAARAARRADRLALALDLLRDPAFDALLTGESRFDELPDVMARLAAGSLPALCHTITYGEG